MGRIVGGIYSIRIGDYMKLKTIRLRKDKDYVYCFLRESTILEEHCDMYEHNLECDKNKDFWGRTHHRGTLAGHTYLGQSGKVLNSCRYCLDEKEEYEEYILPQEAEINKRKRWSIL